MEKCLKNCSSETSKPIQSITLHEWLLDGPLQKLCFFGPVGNSISGHSLTWDLIGKCFFSETSKPVQSKHCVDGHGMDFQNFVR